MAKQRKKQTSELLLALLFSVIAVAGYYFSFAGPYKSVAYVSLLNSQPQTQANNTEIRTELDFEDIPFKTTIVYSNSLVKGSSEITVKGEKGKKTVTYQITLVDGKVVGKNKLSEEVIKKPVDQVVKTGTYLALASTHTLGANTTTPTQPPVPPPVKPCPDGQYLTSYNNCAPIGSTGLCYDGTYTYKTTKYHACFGHNGIKEWYLA